MFMEREMAETLRVVMNEYPIVTISGPRQSGKTTLAIPASELLAGKKLTLAVRPVSSLGTKGKTIGTTWRT